MKPRGDKSLLSLSLSLSLSLFLFAHPPVSCFRTHIRKCDFPLAPSNVVPGRFPYHYVSYKSRFARVPATVRLEETEKPIGSIDFAR